jgi:hypothetical protein
MKWVKYGLIREIFPDPCSPAAMLNKNKCFKYNRITHGWNWNEICNNGNSWRLRFITLLECEKN